MLVAMSDTRLIPVVTHHNEGLPRSTENATSLGHAFSFRIGRNELLEGGASCGHAADPVAGY
jgi:hypothetical protein